MPQHPSTPPSRRRTIRALIASLLVAGVALAAIIVIENRRAIPGRGVVAGSARLPVPSLTRPDCGYSATLVPNCGRWWGIAPLAHTSTPIASGLNQEENAIGRPLDILHVYHTDGQLFPTETERRLALEHGRERILLINWKPATKLTWREVADGGADARIDALAHFIEANWRHPFFLTIWHEPENDVVPTAGSGMTARDYAAMYRHVILRLRADKMTWAVTVMNYIGFNKWALQKWFPQLWPGNDVVDWIGLDPYGTGASSGDGARDFATLVNRRQPGFPGYYTWATTRHRGKPIMLAEWGIAATSSNPSGQARFFGDVGAAISRYPAIKALVYYDMPTPPPGGPRTYLRANAWTLTAYKTLGRRPAIVAPRIGYGG